MSSGLDELEKEFWEEMRKIYTEKTIDHALNPRNVGSISDADGFGKVTGSCGDTMEIWLKIKDDKITQATFWTDGCGTTTACGSIVTEMVKGKSPIEALRIGSEEILESLGGLPEESIHCSVLAAETLREAIRNYLTIKKEPWKKAYQRR